MVEDDKYSGKEFESEEDMHLYWAENHMDELNSHDKDKAKKALRKKKQERNERKKWRRKMMFRGLAGSAAVIVALMAAPSLVSLLTGGGSIDFDQLQLDEQPSLGSEDAEVTVVEFGDYLCPVCREFEQDIKPELDPLIEDRDVRFVYMDLNLGQFDPSSSQASMAAQCVYSQDEDLFWDYHESLYENQNLIDYSTESLVDLAGEEVDKEQLEACIEGQERSDALERDNSIARQNGVSATPTVFVNGDRIDNWRNLAEIIEDDYL